MSVIDDHEEMDDLADAMYQWIETAKYYDDNPEEMWNQGGGLVDSSTGEPVSTDIRSWDAHRLLAQFAYLEHSVKTYNAHPFVTGNAKWNIGKPGTWFRFRFENTWKLRQVKKEILRRMEYLDYLTEVKRKNLGGMK